MKILVTGGAGFIGSHIVDSYILKGHDVVVIDNLYSGKREFINKKAVFYGMDIVDEKLGDVFKREKFDVINHNAAQMSARFSINSPIFDAKVNVLGILNLLENCRKYDVKKFIFASSGGAIYGEPNILPISENSKKKPISPYGMAKKISEDYLDYFYRMYDLNYLSLRYPCVYGPRQNVKGEVNVIAVFMDLLLKNENVQIYGDGEQIRDYIFISDVVEANNVALYRGDNDTFNIGTGVPTTVNQVYNKIKIITQSIGSGVGVDKGKDDVRKNYLDCKKAKEFLDWRYKVDLDSGLKLTYDWFKR